MDSDALHLIAIDVQIMEFQIMDFVGLNVHTRLSI